MSCADALALLSEEVSDMSLDQPSRFKRLCNNRVEVDDQPVAVGEMTSRKHRCPSDKEGVSERELSFWNVTETHGLDINHSRGSETCRLE